MPMFPTCLQTVLTECLLWCPFSKEGSTLVIPNIRSGARYHNLFHTDKWHSNGSNFSLLLSMNRVHTSAK